MYYMLHRCNVHLHISRLTHIAGDEIMPKAAVRYSQ